MNVRRHERKAISPIVATVLIVAATLIAFAAVAGYVFGIFGTAGNTANVQVTGIVLHVGATAGSVSLSNSGTANTQVAAAAPLTLNYGGGSCNYATSAGPTTITAGGAASSVAVPAPTSGVYCTGFTAVAGQTFTGSISLTNGVTVTFTGSFIA